MNTPHAPPTGRPAAFVLSRDRFARISAVEGIALSDGMRRILERFGRDGRGAEERRRAIVRRSTSPSRGGIA